MEGLHTLGTNTTFKVRVMTFAKKICDLILMNHRIDDLVGENSKRGFFEWLSPLDPREKHTDIIEQRLIKTGEWLLETEDFKWWLSEDSISPKIFWCHGARTNKS